MLVLPSNARALPCWAALLWLCFPALARAQGGTVISTAEFLGFLGYAGYYGNELASVPGSDIADDLLVAEPLVYNRVYLRRGKTGVELAEIDNTEFGSPNGFGRGLARLDDVDGDGRGDFAIGAPLNSGGGQVQVFRNRVGLPPLLLYTLTPPGPQLYDFGTSIAGLGDVDGDGLGDFVVGQPGHLYSSVKYPGYAYLYSGGTGTLLRTFSASGGTASSIGYGVAVAAVPDVDGDGLTDIAVTWIQYLSGLNGFVRVYSSASGALIHSFAPVTNELTEFGRDVAGVADLDGDGLGELLIGDPGRNRAYLYSAEDGVLIRELQSPSAQANQQFGYSVDASGDVDGDGLADQLVGAPQEVYGSSGQQLGRAYLFSGATGTRLRTYQKPAGYQPGLPSNDNFGRAVLIAGDQNGDGQQDVAIGAPALDLPLSAGGAVFTFFCLKEVQASVQVRAGTPPNPVAFAAQSSPLIGGVLQTAIDHSAFAPGAFLDVAIYCLAPANLPVDGGTMLVDLGALLTSKVTLAGLGSQAVGIPLASGLVGLPVFVQGVSYNGIQFLAANALDLIIGSY